MYFPLDCGPQTRYATIRFEVLYCPADSRVQNEIRKKSSQIIVHYALQVNLFRWPDVSGVHKPRGFMKDLLKLIEFPSFFGRYPTTYRNLHTLNYSFKSIEGRAFTSLKFAIFDRVSYGKAMTEEQETALLAACGENLLLSTVVTLALNTALRKNEIRTLRWQPNCAYAGRRTHENRGRQAYEAELLAHRMAPRRERRGPGHPVSRSPLYLHYQTRGGTGERANAYVHRGTPQPQDAGALLAHPHGREARGPGRHRQTVRSGRF
jgi:integrase